MLIRRKVRKVLMQRMGLRANNIESHVNGSVTVALSMEMGSTSQQDALVGFAERVQETLSAEGLTGVSPMGGGVKGSVVWLRMTSADMRLEAQNKYGSSLSPEVQMTWGQFEDSVRNTEVVQQVVAEAQNPSTEAEATPITEPIFEIPAPSAEDAEALALLEGSEV